MTLKSDIGADEFSLDFDVMGIFMNKEVPSQEEEDFWEDPYQRLSDSPDMEDVVDQKMMKSILTSMISLLVLRYV